MYVYLDKVVESHYENNFMMKRIWFLMVRNRGVFLKYDWSSSLKYEEAPRWAPYIRTFTLYVRRVQRPEPKSPKRGVQAHFKAIINTPAECPPLKVKPSVKEMHLWLFPVTATINGFTQIPIISPSFSFSLHYPILMLRCDRFT